MFVFPEFSKRARTVLAVPAILVFLGGSGCQAPGTTVVPSTPPPASAAANKKPGTTITTTTIDPANRFKVTAATTSFYKLGPQQPGGPDLGLKQGVHLTLLRRGFGYSQVQLEDSSTGFVGTEDIAKLSSEEVAAENKTPPLAANGTKPADLKPGAPRQRRRPGPSLPIIPGGEPTLPGAPDPTPRPGPVPSFRY